MAAPSGDGQFASMPVSDLFGSAGFNICQEVQFSSTANHVLRTVPANAAISYVTRTTAHASYGWRPVLEWISPKDAPIDAELTPYSVSTQGFTTSFGGYVEDQFYTNKEVSYTSDQLQLPFSFVGATEDQFYTNKDVSYAADPLLNTYDVTGSLADQFYAAKDVNYTADTINAVYGLVGTIPVVSAAAAGKYFRLYVDASNGGGYTELAELEFLNSSGVDIMNTQAPIAVTESHKYAGVNSGLAAIDNDASTRWAATGNTNHWIRLDFATAITIHSLGIVSLGSGMGAYPTRAIKDFRLQVSADGNAWTDVKVWTDQTAWTAGQKRTFVI